ncbi:hypothetical protein PCYB_006550, partial [Plasmodium cynomolgi strain B]
KNKNYNVAFNLYTDFLNSYISNNQDNIIQNYKEECEKIILEKSAKVIELYENFNNDSKICKCDCAKKCSDLYIEYVKECNNNDNDYCRELENFKHKYEEKMKSIETCSNGAHKILPSPIKQDLRVIVIIPIIILTTLSFLLFVLYKVKLFDLPINNRYYTYYCIFY